MPEEASTQVDDRSRRAVNHGAVPVVGGHANARMPFTNAKPRDALAGLSFATHRDVCRPVVTGLKVGVSDDSSIGLPSSNEYSRVTSSRTHPIEHS